MEDIMKAFGIASDEEPEPAAPVARRPVESFRARPDVPGSESVRQAGQDRYSDVDDGNVEVASLGSLSLFSDRVVQRVGLSFRSIMLSEVDSCECRHIKKLPLLIIGCIAGAIGLIALVFGLTEHTDDYEAIAFLGIVVGVVLIILYFVTQRTIVSVNSAAIRLIDVIPASEVSMMMGDASYVRVIRFLEQIEVAKTNYQVKVIAAALRAENRQD